MMDNKKLIEKIKKCMALGKSSEPHEASLALKTAQALMEKYGVSHEAIVLSEINQSDDTPICKSKTPPVYLQGLVQMVCGVFGCQAIYLTERSYDCSLRMKFNMSVSFIGFNPHSELAGYTFKVLSKQLIAGRKEFLSTVDKRLKKSTKTRRANLWAEAWVSAARRKAVFISLSKEKKDLLTKWTEQEMGELRSVKSRPRQHSKNNGDDLAILEGYLQGQASILHHPVNGEAILQIGV